MKSILRLFILALVGTALADDFPTPPNTEPTKGAPLPPLEAAAAIKLPPGFRATLFAAEPDVQQPIAMATDTRGRLWIPEGDRCARPVWFASWPWWSRLARR